MAKRCEGRVALVTGSSRGIGQAIALALAAEGADVVVTGRTETPRKDVGGTIHSTADDVRKLGGRALAVAADLMKPSEIEVLVKRTVEEFGHIDILVNNAAEVSASMYESFWEMTPESWNRQIDLNLTAPFLLCKAVGPHMREQGSGWIVNVSSSYGSHEIDDMPGGEGSPGLAYGASKAGLDRMTLGLAKEFRPFGVAVAAFYPGFTLTEHCETLAVVGGLDPQHAHAVEVPAGRVAELVCVKDPMVHSGKVFDVAASF